MNAIPDELVTDIPTDEVFDLLSSERRRRVLRELRTVEDSITVTELAESIAAIENDVTPSELTDRQRKRVYVSLYQTHVPRLADAGVVDYDDEAGTVALTDRGVSLTDFFTADATEESSSRSRWPLYYLAVVVVGLAASLAQAGFGPFVPAVWIAVALAAAVALVAGVQLARDPDG